jgi:UDP-glucose 4-epimerase
MKALVTGVAGFIGSHLAGTLLERGATVTGLDCFTDYYPRPIKEANLATVAAHDRFRFVETSIQDADLDALLDDVTHVFHLAAQAGVRKSWGRDFQIYTTNNVDATQILLESVVGRPIEKLVYAVELVGLRRRHADPDARAGAAAPALAIRRDQTRRRAVVPPVCRQSRRAGHCRALLHVYGPRQRPDMGFHRFLKAAINGSPITVYGDGEQTRDFTFVGGRGGGHDSRRRARRSGRAYNIGGGSRVSINHVLDLIAEISGRPIDIRREPSQKGDMRDTYADTSLARADLGFSPTTSLKDGLTAEYHWLLTSPVLA